MTGQKKGIYHSELESASKDAPVRIILEQGPSPQSRNKNIAGFVTITDWNGVSGRYINIENAHVLAALQAAPVGVPIFVRAWGKGPDARLEVVGVDNDSAPPRANPGAAPAPPAARNGSNGSRGADMIPITREHWMCLKAAHAVLMELIEKYPDQYGNASADARLEFVRTSATNYRMDLVHNPDRPLMGQAGS